MMRHLIIYGLLAAALVCAPEATLAQDFRVGSGSAADARRQARLFDEHVVRMGETAFSIARGYAISPLVMAEDNPGLDLERLRAGQVVLMSFSG